MKTAFIPGIGFIEYKDCIPCSLSEVNIREDLKKNAIYHSKLKKDKFNSTSVVEWMKSYRFPGRGIVSKYTGVKIIPDYGKYVAGKLPESTI